MKDIIEKRLADFKAAEERGAKALAELKTLRAQVEKRIVAAETEILLNNAGRQTCEQLLKELATSDAPATENGEAKTG